MNIFGFRPFKGRFNLGNSDDIPTNTDGTLIGAVKQINSNLTASNSQKFRFGYQGGKYGYITESGGADTFHPFSSGLGINDNQCVWVTPTLASVKTITNGSVTVTGNNGGATVLFKADTYVGKTLQMHFDDQPYAAYMTFGAAIFNGTSWSSRTGTSVVIPSGAKYIVVNAVGGLGSWSGTMSLT